MKNKIKQGSFVAISDFHSNRWPLDEKIPKYLNQYDVIYILGDATDRGKDDYGNQLEGKGGVRLLLDIMHLCKKYPNHLVYLPGNHDEFLYYYAAHKNTELGSYMSSNLLINGGYYTKNDIDNLRENNPQLLEDLINWLGSLPIQRTHIYNGQRYCLAHAFFNEKIYQNNPDYSLEDMYQDNSMSEYDSNSAYSQILWFRKSDIYMNYNSSSVPSNSIIVIGHTPEQIRKGEDLDLKNSDGLITTVKCVDGGITYSSNDGKMLKYVSGDTDVIHTERGPEFYENRNVYSEDNLTSYETKTFIEAMIATSEKYGMNQIRGFIIDRVYQNNPCWFLPIIRKNNHRVNVQELGLSKVKTIIESYSPLNEKDPYILAENLINKLSTIIKESYTKRRQSSLEERTISIKTTTEDTFMSSDIIKMFEEEKTKIMKARFSDEQKQILIKELEDEYEGITDSGKTNIGKKI